MAGMLDRNLKMWWVLLPTGINAAYWIIWLHSFSSAVTPADRAALFLSYFPWRATPVCINAVLISVNLIVVVLLLRRKKVAVSWRGFDVVVFLFFSGLLIWQHL